MMIVKLAYLAGSLAFTLGSVLALVNVNRPALFIYLAGSLLFATGTALSLLKA